MKISIITTSWNSGKTIRDTINSVLAQTHTDFEHIIIDGGSKDDTMSIVRELEPLYRGRLRYISEPDKGIYDAMNKGLRMASGDVIGTLNSDDFFSSNDILQTIADNINGHDAVYADVHYIRGNNIHDGVRFYSSRRFRRWQMCMGFMPAHPSFYCKREVYDNFGHFDLDYKIASDFELVLRFIYLHNINTKYIRKNFVTMRIGGASTSGLQSHKQILKDHLNAYKKNKVYSNYLLEGCRYAYKLVELSYYKVRLMITRKLERRIHGPLETQTPADYILSWQDPA